MTTKQESEEEIMKILRNVAEKHGVSVKEFFKAFYLCVLGKERGPRASTLILSAGRENIAQVLLTLKTSTGK